MIFWEDHCAVAWLTCPVTASRSTAFNPRERGTRCLRCRRSSWSKLVEGLILSPRSLLRDSRGLFNCELVPLKAKGGFDAAPGRMVSIAGEEYSPDLRCDPTHELSWFVKLTEEQIDWEKAHEDPTPQAERSGCTPWSQVRPVRHDGDGHRGAHPSVFHQY